MISGKYLELAITFSLSLVSGYAACWPMKQWEVTKFAKGGN